MPGARLEGRAKAHKAAMDSINELEARFARNVEELIHDIDKHIKSLTPVNTGQAVRNYIWSRNTPNSIVYEAVNNGPPGPTNSMSLGSEPRRGPNEAAAAESLGTLGVTENPFATFYLSNMSPDIVGLDLGILPGPPLKSRSPRGMFGITQAYFSTLVAAKGMFK